MLCLVRRENGKDLSLLYCVDYYLLSFFLQYISCWLGRLQRLQQLRRLRRLRRIRRVRTERKRGYFFGHSHTIFDSQRLRQRETNRAERHSYISSFFNLPLPNIIGPKEAVDARLVGTCLGLSGVRSILIISAHVQYNTIVAMYTIRWGIRNSPLYSVSSERENKQTADSESFTVYTQ